MTKHTKNPAQNDLLVQSTLSSISLTAGYLEQQNGNDEPESVGARRIYAKIPLPSDRLRSYVS